MGFTADISTMAKYKQDPLVATGLNCSLFSLMEIFVSSAAFNFSPTSWAFAFVDARTSTSSSSSRRFPVLLVSLSSNEASKANNDLVLALTSCNTKASCSSKARCSFPITFPRSCSSRPFCVTCVGSCNHDTETRRRSDHHEDAVFPKFKLRNR